MPKGIRGKDNRTITVSLPKSLVAEIDQLARAERRSRSNWIVTQLEDMIKRKAAGTKIAHFKKNPRHRNENIYASG